jgi:hypothetical protein
MLSRRFTTWQFEVLESALAAGTTIALRSSDAMGDLAAGKRPDQRENSLMVTEKAAALSAGLFAAGLEMNRQWMRAAMTGSLAPADSWLRLLQAGSKPARLSVRKNAKRLSKRTR